MRVLENLKDRQARQKQQAYDDMLITLQDLRDMFCELGAEDDGIVCTKLARIIERAEELRSA